MDYQFVASVGVGAHGRVDHYIHTPTQCPVAIKKCQDANKEVSIMNKLNQHEHVIPLLTSFHVGREIWMVMPL